MHIVSPSLQVHRKDCSQYLCINLQFLLCPHLRLASAPAATLGIFHRLQMPSVIIHPTDFLLSDQPLLIPLPFLSIIFTNFLRMCVLPVLVIGSLACLLCKESVSLTQKHLNFLRLALNFSFQAMISFQETSSIPTLHSHMFIHFYVKLRF